MSGVALALYVNRKLHLTGVLNGTDRATHWQREGREHKNVLFPIRIDDYLFGAWEHPRKAAVVGKGAGNSTGWENLAGYNRAFPGFLDALNRPQTRS